MTFDTLFGSVDALISEQITGCSKFDVGGTIGLFLGTWPSLAYIIPPAPFGSAPAPVGLFI